MHGNMQASGLTELIPFICPQLSGAKSCFLSPKGWPLLVSTPHPSNQASQQSLLVVAASAISHFGEPSFTLGGQKLLMAVTFLALLVAGDISFHNTFQGLIFQQLLNIQCNSDNYRNPVV